MMPSSEILKSIVSFVNVAADATVALPHGLINAGERLAPDQVTPEFDSFEIVSADATSVTVKNNGVVASDCDVLCEAWHPIERQFGDYPGSFSERLSVSPFVGAKPVAAISTPLAYGELHFADPGTITPIDNIGEFVKAANTSFLNDASANVTMPFDNRLLYSGIGNIVCLLNSSLSFKCASNNQILAFAVAIDGAVYVPSIVRTKIASGADIQAVALVCQVELASGSYAEIWVANDTSTGDITIDHGNTVLRG